MQSIFFNYNIYYKTIFRSNFSNYIDKNRLFGKNIKLIYKILTS